MPPAPAPSQHTKINLFTRPTKLLFFRSKTAPKIPEPRITPGIERLPLHPPEHHRHETPEEPSWTPKRLRPKRKQERKETRPSKAQRTTPAPSAVEKTWS